MPMPSVLLPKQKLILDSDGGVDDALCIVLAARLLRPEQLIISSVFGNVGVEQASRNLSFLLNELGLSSHVVGEGAAQATDGFFRDATAVHGDDGLGGVTAGAPFSPSNIRPLRSLVADLENTEAGQFKILAIGPATNVPTIIEMLGRDAISDITLMAGSVFDNGNVTKTAEFNAFNDPIAINEVIKSGIPVNIVPLDLCRKIVFERRNLDCLKKLGRISDVLIPAHMHYMTFYNEWEGIEGCYPHDSIALMVSLFPGRFYSVGVDVEAEVFGEARGRLSPRSLDSASHVRVFTGGNLRWARALFNSDIALEDWVRQAAGE
jgi:purine nucleosidase